LRASIGGGDRTSSIDADAIPDQQDHAVRGILNRDDLLIGPTIPSVPITAVIRSATAPPH